MKNEVIELAIKIRSIYEQGSSEEFSLFMGSFQFPKNSCEGASRVFAHIITTRFPDCNIHVVEGYDYPNDDRHYWVQIDDLIYDLTCDQFNISPKIILGERTTPLITKYNDLEFISGRDIFENWSPGGRYNKLDTLGYVEYHLERTYK